MSRRKRIYGLGSIYAKTLRDSRRAFLIAAGLLAGMMLAVSAGIASIYATQAARDEIVRLATGLGAVGGLAGKAVNIGTLGGYVQWKYGPVFLWVVALWSILALSATLAAEARRGSLDFVAAAPFGKRRIALEKLAAHVTALTLAVAVTAGAAWLAGRAYARLPDDAIPVQAAVGLALWLELVGLLFGALAFALAQFLGRGPAAGIAGAILFVGYVLNNYQALPALHTIANLTPWAWTANHLPLAGQYDWASLTPLPLLTVALFAIGIEGFARRDLGASIAVRTPNLPASVLGLRGPIGRSFGERLPLALAWGLGIGSFGFVMATISRIMADEVAKSPNFAGVFQRLFPAFDVLSVGGFIQLMVQLLYIVAGFAAATFVAGWASDETGGRLELLLATPLGRAQWAIRSGLGAFAAIAAMTGVTAVAIGAGAAAAGSDALAPMAGTIALGLYAAALCGVGFAVGGLIRTSIAAEIVAAVVIATYLIDLLAPALNLPEWVHRVALTAHFGQTMVGSWDTVGIVASVVLALGGLALGAWGFTRRDVRS